MDAAQIELVQDSFTHVVPIPDRAASHFYCLLFERAPETRALFKNDMTEQGQKLVLTLATVVGGLDRLDTILPVARELAIRHVRYGVVDRHYAIVGDALIDTLRDLLGTAFDAETEAAWGAAYGLLSGAMIEASRKAA